MSETVQNVCSNCPWRNFYGQAMAAAELIALLAKNQSERKRDGSLWSRKST